MLPEIVRQDEARAHAVRSAAVDGLPDDDLAVQIGAGGKDDRLRPVELVQLGDDARHAAVFHGDVRHHELLQVQIVRILHAALHPAVVGVLVGLCPEGIHCRPLAAVQHAHLDGRGIRRDAHDAAQRVDLPHQMALARAADGGVAGHHGHIVQRDRGEERFHAQLRRGERRLTARVARADDDHIIRIDQIHGRIPSFNGEPGLPETIHCYYRRNAPHFPQVRYNTGTERRLS